MRRNLMWRWDGEQGKHVLVGVPKTRSAHMLNPIGAKIFILCDGKHTITDIVSILKEEFPEAAYRISDDVIRFIEYLCSLEIVEQIR